MSDQFKFLLLAIGFGVLLLIAMRWGVVGVRGGSVRQSESPAVFWLAVAALIFAALASLAAATGIWP
jgi:hypothetical protein